MPAKRPKRPVFSRASHVLKIQIEADRVRPPFPEYRFDPVRRWRFDFAWPLDKLAVEIEGGISKWVPGRHQRAEGMQKDLDKYNAAVLAGWRLLRFSSTDVLNGRAIAGIKIALSQPRYSPEDPDETDHARASRLRSEGH